MGERPELITLGAAEFFELQWAAFAAGVPLRVCMAPGHAVARLQWQHRQARLPMDRDNER